jgi:hypothetical protein
MDDCADDTPVELRRGYSHLAAPDEKAAMPAPVTTVEISSESAMSFK